MADYIDIKKWVVGGIIISIFILAFLILRPIIIPIIFGLLFAYMFSPLYRKIHSKIKNENAAALLMMFGIVILVAVPIIYLIPIIVRQASEVYIAINGVNVGEVLNKLMEDTLKIPINFDTIIYKISSTFQGQFEKIINNFVSIVFQFAVFLFTFYFTLRDADKVKEYISTLSPFSGETEEKFLKEFRGITNAIIFGQVLIGIAQGLAVGVALYFLGVPRVLILTFITSIVSMIPVLGSWMIWLPMGLYLILTGQTFNGAFLLLYGALFVSTIDNLIRPYILSRQSNLPIALSVIGTIGGLYFFGIAGLILGPLVLAYVLIIVEFYRKGKLNDLFNK